MNRRALAFLATLGLALGDCAGGKQGPRRAPLAVDVTKVVQRDIVTQLTFDGQISPLFESTPSTPESGTVAQVLVNEGDRVSQGQLLARLDDSQLRAQLAASQAAVQQARAKLRSSRVQAPISSQQYSSAVASAEQNLQAAQNRLATGEAALRNAELVYHSDQSLVAQGYVSQTTMTQARASYVAAIQEVNNAKQALPAAQAALVTAHTNTGQTQVDQANVEADRAALAQAQADVVLLQTQIAQSAIFAPFGGVITQRLLDPGAFAGPNAAIVRVSALDTVYVNANVPDEDLPYVQAGTRAQFTSASVPATIFRGRIADVNAVPTTGTLSYRARIREPNPGNLLRGGMLVTVTVERARHRHALVVPRTALFEGDRGANIYTVVDGKAKLLPVDVGLQTDTLAEVSGSGVRPGTIVITTLRDKLQDGSVVAILGGEPSAR